MAAIFNPTTALPFMSHTTLATRHAGFGLGLRTAHYADFLAAKQPLDWLEIITDNYLVEGGKPLAILDTIRRDYPMAMHGVAMSIGAAQGVDVDYLRKVKALANRINPLWVSDHLCWTGPGPEQLHDLFPLPYTDEAARHVIAQITQAQDILGRRLVLENVSSYIQYPQDSSSEWQFLSHIAQAADCLLLVDVNNIYVSSVNHQFDPVQYLDALPAQRVQQIHLAGHENRGDHIIDTHDHPVASAVWDLYAKACQRFGAVASMIERDDHIPPLPDLLAEMQMARQIASEHCAPAVENSPKTIVGSTALPQPTPTQMATGLAQSQRAFANYVLTDPMPVAPATPDVQGRPHIYHHAYRARLVDVLADTFAKTYLYMGSDTFDDHAGAYVVAYPPLHRSLHRYGEGMVEYLHALYPDNPELHELAQLDWDLRTRFDSADHTALSVADANSVPWLSQSAPLHPSALLRPITTNVMALWNAIHTDQDVPEAVALPQPTTLVVWRKEQQPHFRSLVGAEAQFIRLLHQGLSVEAACAQLVESGHMPDTPTLSGWLGALLQDGLVVTPSETPYLSPMTANEIPA